MPTQIMSSCDEGFMWCFANWGYTVTNGFLWTLILLAFCVSLLMATMRFGTTRAFGYASFVGLLGSIYLAIMQLMPWWTASAFILTGAVGIVSMIISER